MNFNKPFRSINGASIAIFFNHKYNQINLDVRFNIINKYFESKYEAKELKAFFSGVESISSKYPKDFFKNFQEIKNKIQEISDILCHETVSFNIQLNIIACIFINICLIC
jgi:hypothetical protein